METHEAIFAELEQMREGAAALLRAKMDAMAGQIRDQATRVAGDLSVVVPPDLEALLPIASLAERLKSLATPPPPPPAPVLALDLDVLRRLDAGRAQSEVLQELLRQLGAWCGPRAIAVFRDGNAQGWSSAGFESGNPARAWHGTVAASPALTRAAAGTPVIVQPRADAVLSEWFGGGDERLFVVPMALRGKVVGVLLALDGGPGLNVPMVQQLTYTVGLMLETLAARPSVPTPTLAEPELLAGEPAAVEVPPAVLEAVPVAAEEAPAAAEEVPVAAVEAEPQRRKSLRRPRTVRKPFSSRCPSPRASRAPRCAPRRTNASTRRRAASRACWCPRSASTTSRRCRRASSPVTSTAA